jgi:NitT/TauT family transport system substrate-binding protein
MARARLTPLSKILIVAIIVAAIGYLLYQLRSPEIQEKIESISDISSKSKKAGFKDVINVGVVTWGGYAGGQYFNNGFTRCF